MEGKQLPEIYESKGEDVLVIAGDLHVGKSNVLRQLYRFSQFAKEVVYVMGNHELYKHSIAEFDDLKRTLERMKCTNIHFLNPGSVKIKDVTFIGGALWTNFREDYFATLAAKTGITDFHVIEGMTPHCMATWFTEHFKYIKEAYEKTVGKKVIVTHFLPAIECIAPEFQDPEDLINYYFANDLGGWISELSNVPYWLFGHTHTITDVKIGNTRCIANPYGYYKQENYRERIIEL